METQLNWFKATLSAHNGGCVETAKLPDGGMAVRNSRHPGGPVNEFTAHEWECFLDGVRKGEFNL